eukprot:GILK01004492.1.p1 GENE.GILK01004492.1~~GILK01004492.1.p1  ORF type:complete len:756 (-),score=124.46 GILK01004492.1:62-2131(-)
MAYRIYSTRLFGRDSQLVLHGGGNSSVKISIENTLGELEEVLAVKGSGSDMAEIEASGFPLLQLEFLRKLRKLSDMSEDLMLNMLKTHQLDHKAPSPSVETLLHAFLPHKYIDHTHADSILAVLGQQNAEALAEKIFDMHDLALVEYTTPGFKLARRVAEAFEGNPGIKGILLQRHGLITFGATAKESYETHIQIVQEAENYIRSHERKRTSCSFFLPNVSLRPPSAPYSMLVNILRGLFFERSGGQLFVFHHRCNPAIEEFANCEEVTEWSRRGPATPDHSIRTKPYPLLLLFDDDLDPVTATEERLRGYLRSHIEKYCMDYHQYFLRNQSRISLAKKELDPLPRIILMRGVGMISAAPTFPQAFVAADVYEHTIDIIRDAMTIGTFAECNEKDIFDMEYWHLEQTKVKTNFTLPTLLPYQSTPSLNLTVKQPLQGQVCYITGGASGIGLATAELFGQQGACLYITDLDQENLVRARMHLRKLNISVVTEQADVTDLDLVTLSFHKLSQEYGGVDIVISNAGRAYQSPIADVATDLLMESFDVNFFAHQWVSSRGVQIMKRQRYGGCILFNASKSAVNPAPSFGPYAIAKAATLALMRQYALEYGADKIRCNAVNADRVRTGLVQEEVPQERATVRGFDPNEYFRSNMLRTEVLVADVAQAFLKLALSPKTTCATLTVDGGNLAASLR